MRIDSMDANMKLLDRPIPTQPAPSKNPGKSTNSMEDTRMAISEKTVIGAVERANKAMVASNRALEFSVHEKTKEIMVRVIDSETKEVVREIPSEKILDMVANILEMAGILVDERR